MSERKKYSQPFKPYARLMNIIGDQLITDKKVAVIEVVKIVMMLMPKMFRFVSLI